MSIGDGSKSQSITVTSPGSDLVNELKIPSLSAHGMSESNIPEAAQKTMNASSYKGNPIPLSEGELREVLEKAL